MLHVAIQQKQRYFEMLYYKLSYWNYCLLLFFLLSPESEEQWEIRDESLMYLQRIWGSVKGNTRNNCRLRDNMWLVSIILLIHKWHCVYNKEVHGTLLWQKAGRDAGPKAQWMFNQKCIMHCIKIHELLTTCMQSCRWFCPYSSYQH